MFEDLKTKLIGKMVEQGKNMGFKIEPKLFLYRRWLVFTVTTRCNFSCPHCLKSAVDKKKTCFKDIPLSVVEKTLEGAKGMDFDLVCFTGGEAILHPQFKDIVSLVAGKYGYEFNYTSNGWFHKEYWEIIEKYRKNIRNLSLSFDGVTPEVHDSVRNRPGSFERAVESAKFYIGKGINVGLNFCVTSKNIRQIEKMPGLCRALGVKSVRWMTVIPAYDKNNVDIIGNSLTDEERAVALRKILSLKKKFEGVYRFAVLPSFYPFPENFVYEPGEEKIYKQKFPCPLMNADSEIFIDEDGGMFFCTDINRECAKKPLAQELGFEKALELTMDWGNEMKKKMINRQLRGGLSERWCDFCVKNIEDGLNTAVQKKGGGVLGRVW